MNPPPDLQIRNIGAGLDNGSEGEIRRRETGNSHIPVEEESVPGEAGLGGCSDEGVEEEGVGAGDGEKEEAGVVDGAGEAGGSEELGEQGAAAAEAQDDDLGMDLPELRRPAAGEEESLVRMRMAGVWFHESLF